MDQPSEISRYLFTQGILGVACFVLGFVIVYQQRKYDRDISTRDARITHLMDLRLEDSKEVTRDVTTVLQQNSQSNLVLAEKIESGKRSNR